MPVTWYRDPKHKYKIACAPSLPISPKAKSAAAAAVVALPPPDTPYRRPSGNLLACAAVAPRWRRGGAAVVPRWRRGGAARRG